MGIPPVDFTHVTKKKKILVTSAFILAKSVKMCLKSLMLETGLGFHP